MRFKVCLSFPVVVSLQHLVLVFVTKLGFAETNMFFSIQEAQTQTLRPGTNCGHLVHFSFNRRTSSHSLFTRAPSSPSAPPPVEPYSKHCSRDVTAGGPVSA
uniref:Putative secreted protein n=1 Tax=Anopheles marajoara TaxID=58244 RepID=A0A2M4C8L4_9DIPT